MDPTTPAFDWSSLLLDKGPLYVMFALFIYGVVRYGPSIVNGHLAHIKSNTETNERLTTCYETLTEAQTGHSNGHVKTHRALAHMVDAAHDASTCPDVRDHLNKAKRELEL